MRWAHSIIGATVLALLQPSTCAEGVPETHDGIRTLIDRSRAAADMIRIDGGKADWAHLVGFSDLENESIEDSTRDIERVSIAPTEHALYVQIETVGKPSKAHHAFWLNIDLFGHKEADVRIGIGASGQHKVKTFIEEKSSALKEEFETAEITAKIDSIVEIRIPYTVLKGRLAQSFTTDPSVAGFRPFVRVNAYTWDSGKRQFPDFGPSVASYHLLKMRYSLDSELPGGKEAPRAIAFPFSDRHFVGNGALGLRAHVGKYAYDFYITDVQLEAAKRPRSRQNDDYYTWGKEVIAPVQGRIVRSVDKHEDLAPLDKQDKSGNEVRILSDDGYTISLYHLKKGTALVEEGAKVKLGAAVGQVGNSGISGWPHIHLTMFKNGRPRQGLPIALTNVVVGLNPTHKDPWARASANWTIREGYFVGPNDR